MTKRYKLSEDEPQMVCEPELALATECNVKKVNMAQLMSQGYMTLEQSKALIEKKIHNHFHS